MNTLEELRDWLIERGSTQEDIQKTELGNWIVFNRKEGLYEKLPKKFIEIV